MKNQIEAFKAKLDIIDVIGYFLPLKKQGRHYFALCPFHHEKTGSFCVDSQYNYFKCFSCDAQGDMIEFVKKYKNLDFKEACLLISQITGVYFDSGVKSVSNEVLKNALKSYANAFKNSPAYLYAKRRGINEESMQKFELGYGTFIANYDPMFNLKAFRGRLVFPIFSGQRLVGFGGRDIEGRSHAKYLNSPQSPLFNKQTLLYALNNDSIMKNDSVYIVEGYLDVILAHQNGFTNVTAALGVALNKEHFSRLLRLTSNIILALDKDKAGLVATFKAIETAFSMQIDTVKVLLLDTKCKDLADFFSKEENAKAKFENAKAVPAFEFIVDFFMQGFKQSDILIQNEKIKKIQFYMDKIQNDFLKATYERKIIEKYRLPLKTFKESIKKPERFVKGIKNIAEAGILKALVTREITMDYLTTFLDDNDFTHYKNDFLAIQKREKPENLYEILSFDSTDFEVRVAILAKLKSKLQNEKENILKNENPQTALKMLLDNQKKIKEIEESLNEYAK